jgi:hypothetical protein
MADGGATVARLDVYGLTVSVSGDWPEVVDAVRLDFAWFEAPDHAERAALEVVVERGPPDFDGLGEARAAFVTPRNVVFQQDGRTIVDYFGRAVSVLDRRRGSLLVQGEDAHLVHEAVYHFLLSSIGRHVDGRGLPRLHALAVAGAQGGVAVLLPSGGGKSTLALRALQTDGVRLVAEDSPLIDRQGQLHPFPLRIGVNETDGASLPPERVRRIERMEFHPKLVVDVGAFADRIESRPVPLRHIVVGRRSLGRGAELAPAGKSTAIGPLLRECVVGVGLYQGMEFILQRGLRDVVGSVGTALARGACCSACVSRASVWKLTLGRDHERNWAVLETLLR